MLLCISLKVFLAFLWLGSSIAQTVKQTHPAIQAQELNIVTLSCTYDTSSTTYSLYWYKQLNHQKMILLIRQDSYGQKNASEGRYSVNFQKTSKSIELFISSSQVEDSAVYFCALNEPDNYKLIFGAGTTVTIRPNIPDPKPAVYQLTNSKSNNMSVCLFTDFDSRMNTSEVKKPTAIGTTTTVLDMRSTGSKSNGILAWTSSGDSSCNETFSLNNSYFFSSDSSCNAKLVEENFRTDWDMNFQNLSVMALRILFLKLTGFNLLMTLRLWSS